MACPQFLALLLKPLGGYLSRLATVEALLLEPLLVLSLLALAHKRAEVLARAGHGDNERRLASGQERSGSYRRASAAGKPAVRFEEKDDGGQPVDSRSCRRIANDAANRQAIRVTIVGERRQLQRRHGGR